MGCGRYHKSHAVTHFSETEHRFTVELDSQFIWDYEGDGYVHRLLLRAAKDLGVRDDLSDVDSPEPVVVSGVDGSACVHASPARGTRNSNSGLDHLASSLGCDDADVYGKRLSDDEEEEEEEDEANRSAYADGTGDDDRLREEDEMVNIKLQSMCAYYNNLLTTQLQQQCLYFENKIADSDRELTERMMQIQVSPHPPFFVLCFSSFAEGEIRW